jgi:beta-glucanase (GH16 family)
MPNDYGTRKYRSPYGNTVRQRASRARVTASWSIASVLVIGLSLGIGIASARSGQPTTGHPSVHQAAAPEPPESWKLKFDAAFTGSNLDTHTWETCYPWAASGCTNFGNTEFQWYLASQDKVRDGVLQLVAQREPTRGTNKNGEPKEYACRSGMVTSYPSLRFEYGYIEITAEIPFGNGLWPAFWLAAANQKWPPEIDILEHWGTELNGKAYLHPTTGPRQSDVFNTPNLASGWHTFSLYWTETQLIWYYDGNQVFSTTTGIPHQEMYLIANLADYQPGPRTCAGSLLIKSVKLWQP